MFKGKLTRSWKCSDLQAFQCLANHDMFKGVQGNKELAQMFEKANDMEKISYSSI